MHWNPVVFGLCNVVSICLAISFESTAIATNNLSSITALPLATRACGGCSIAEHHFQFDWYSEVFTHTAATIVKIVNNSTNVTRTSTIRGSNFIIPSQARYAAIPVSGVVITTDIGGVDYTLTYPTAYHGINQEASYTWFVATDSAGSLSCVASTVYITRPFLLQQYASIDDLHSSIGTRSCNGSAVSPPQVLVPVLSLTQTETTYERSPALETSSVSKAAPSKPIAAPTVTPTISSESIPPKSPPTLPQTPIIESRPTKPSILPQTTSEVKPPPPPPSRESQSLDQASASSEDTPLASKATESALQPSRINGETAGASKDTSGLGSANSSPSSPTTIIKSITFTEDEEPSKDSATDRASVSDSVTASPTPTPPLILSIGSSVISANPDGDLVIANQTLTPGGSPVTASGKSIYLLPSGAAAVIDGSTVSLQTASPKSSYPTPPAILPTGSSRTPANPKDASIEALAQAPKVLTFGTQALKKEKTGDGYIIGSQTLIPGDAPITVAGTRFSLAPSASELIVGSSTIAPQPERQILLFGAEVLVADSSGGFVLGKSQTLVPGHAPVTIEGTPVWLAPSASALIVGSATFAQTKYTLPPVRVHIQTVTAPIHPSEYLIAGQTLVPGAPPISISGKAVSLAPGESQVVIGSSTKTLTSSEKPGLASLILQGLGDLGSSDATPTESSFTDSSTASAQYTGDADRRKGKGRILWIGLGILTGLGILI